MPGGDTKHHCVVGDVFWDYCSGSDEGVSTYCDSTEDGPGVRGRINLDYTFPLNDTRRFETGYQSRLGDSKDETAKFVLNASSGEYDELSEFRKLSTYQRNIHSIYSLFADEVGKLGYQAGLRGEFTDRKIEYGNDEFNIDRFGLFPTAHISYNPSLTPEFQYFLSVPKDTSFQI